MHLKADQRPLSLWRLRQIRWSVALVRFDDLAGVELNVGVSRIHDLLLLVVHDGESGEALVGSELPGPASADGVWAADPAKD